MYFAAYIASAAIFQLRSETPPWIDGSPIEYFTGGLLWMSSLISLLMAEILLGKSRTSWIWLLASVGLAFLAIDEIFSLHEKTAKIVGDDDYIKIAQWIFTGGVIYFVTHLKLSSSRTKIAFVIGYITHTLYILSEVGDGEFFEFPFVSLAQLKTAEEYLELLALTAYCIGLIFLYTNTLRANLTRGQ